MTNKSKKFDVVRDLILDRMDGISGSVSARWLRGQIVGTGIPGTDFEMGLALGLSDGTFALDEELHIVRGNGQSQLWP